MKKYIIILITLITLFLVSCNPDGIGIFYQISVEPQLSKSTLSEKSVYKIVNDGTTNYVLAGGAIYKGSSLDIIAAPPDKPDIQAFSIASISTDIYSVYVDNEIFTMYKLNDKVWEAPAGTFPIENHSDLTLIQVDNNINNIFLSVEVTIGSYKLYLYNGSDFTNLTGEAIITMPIVSATYDGSNYYLVSSNKTNNFGNAVLYSTNGISTVDTTTVPGPSVAIGSILYYSPTLLFITGKDGILYSSNESVGPASLAWTAVNDALPNTNLGPMDIVTIANTDYLLIGSDNGFYEMTLPSGSPAIPTITIGETPLNTIPLGEEIVQCILSDSPNYWIGSSNGLWYGGNTTKIDLK